MTPSEVATDINGLNPVENVNGPFGPSTNFTYSFQRLDDSNTWD